MSCDPADGDVGVSCDDKLLKGVVSLATGGEGLTSCCPGN